MNNPYSPPTAEIEDRSPPKKPGLLWKLYFGFYIILFITGYSFTIEDFVSLSFSFYDALGVPLSLLGTLGFYYYVFSKEIRRLTFWKSLFVIIILFDLYGILIDSQYEDDPISPLTLLLTILFILWPYYLGLFRLVTHNPRALK